MRARQIVTAIALVFFFTPVALRVAGVTAHQFENRPLATFPKPSAGWGAFDQATRFFVDRLPLREQAVHANTAISEHVFHSSPTYGASAGALPFGAPATTRAKSTAPATEATAAAPGAAPTAPPPTAVLRGKRGWLYLEAELVRTCSPFTTWSIAMHRWERLAQTIRASGRRVVLVIPPDKSTVYPQYLPAAFAERACAPAGRAAAWAAIENSKDPAIVGMRQRILGTSPAPPNESYFRKDTHWNTKGGTLAVLAALERLDGGVTVGPREILKQRTTYTGDLTNLIGASEQDSSAKWTIARPGLAPLTGTTEQLPGGGTGQLLQRPPGGPPVLAGRTLLIDDSYGEAMIDALQPYVSTLSVVQWYGPTPLPSLIAAIDRADTVILETVERDLNFKASANGIVTPPFIAAVRRTLTQK